MTALQWMQKEAKIIQRKHPRMKWPDVMKKAGMAYRKSHKSIKGVKVAKKVSGAKKVGALKVVEKKITTTAKKVGSISSHTFAIKQLLIKRIGDLEGKKLLAGARDRARIQKLIVENRKQLRLFLRK